MHGYQRLVGRGDGYSKAERARIDKALRLYLKAAEAGGKFDLANKIRVALKELEDEEKEEVDSESEIRYNINYSRKSTKTRKIAEYISNSKIGRANLDYLENELRKLYSLIYEGIANDVAIEKGNVIYIVDSGKEKGRIDFAVKRRMQVSNPAKRKFYIQKINEEAAKNEFGDRTVFERLGVALDRDSGSDVGRKQNENARNSKEKPQDNKGGVPAKDGNNGGLKYSRKITAEMSDSERAEILKDKVAVAPIYEGQADTVIESVKRDYEREKKRFGKKAIVEIAEKLNVIDKAVSFEDVDVKILLSKGNISESITKEASPEQIARLLPILSETAKSSVLIERHHNRYYYDSDTVYFDNLVGAYVDGENIIPVRFGLKHSRTGSATLYVVVDQNRIPLENLDKKENDRGHSDTGADKSAAESPLSSVKYSIAQILSFVNSKDLLRYIPDDFLTDEQIKSKREAIAETEKYTDKKTIKSTLGISIKTV